MMFINSKMRGIWPTQIQESKFALATRLQELLHAGFSEIGDCIFFKGAGDNSNFPSHEFIQSAYGDLSGYESARNKINIEEYCSEDILQNSIEFLFEFNKKWMETYRFKVIAAVTYDSDPEIGPSATFRFHLARPGEIVFDTRNIDKFIDPLIVSITDPQHRG